MSSNHYNGLPRFCYAPNPYNGDKPAVIYPDDSVYYRAEHKVSQSAIQMGVDALNQLVGVTPPQASAMRAGITHGWEDPRANPAAYDAEGKYHG